MIALAGKEEKDLIYFEQNATIKRAQESVSGMQAWSILEHYVMEFVASNDWCISSTYGVDVHQISDFQKLSNRPVTVRVTRHPTSEEHGHLHKQIQARPRLNTKSLTVSKGCHTSGFACGFYNVGPCINWLLPICGLFGWRVHVGCKVSNLAENRDILRRASAKQKPKGNSKMYSH